ncbi:hypothetical protein L3Y34_000244 [Caenorhabditis briggsae]|uniref:Uncharacterized protein n=1 Tax=Caenorhabditis briggsae TaxID=6238 RepID=A0AAE9D8U3_CAEBR|nr:hypothetical protein L3Y34_000244 [Caenorhabditis briggsae]
MTSTPSEKSMVELVHELAGLLRETKDDEAKRLLTRHPNLVGFKDDSGRSTVHFAAVGGSLPLLQFAILNDSEMADKEDDLGWTPLMIASSAGRVEVVRYLLGLSNVNAAHTNSNRQSSLHYACSKNHVEIAKLLIEAAPEAVNLPDKFGATALHRASSRGNDVIVRALIGSGKCSLDRQDSEGNTALHLACDENRADVALLLAHRGADIGLNNNEKKSPLQLAKDAELRHKLKVSVGQAK